MGSNVRRAAVPLDVSMVQMSPPCGVCTVRRHACAVRRQVHAPIVGRRTEGPQHRAVLIDPVQLQRSILRIATDTVDERSRFGEGERSRPAIQTRCRDMAGNGDRIAGQAEPVEIERAGAYSVLCRTNSNCPDCES